MKFTKSIILIFATSLFLSSCASVTPPQTVDIISNHYKVIIPPSSIMRCGAVKLPDTFKDNKEVAESYIKLWKHNNFCHNNFLAIKKYLHNADENLNKK